MSRELKLAFALAVLGAGVTLAAAFVSSLDLSIGEQRVGFAFGVALFLAGCAWAIQLVRKGGAMTPSSGDTYNQHNIHGPNIGRVEHLTVGSVPRTLVGLDTTALRKAARRFAGTEVHVTGEMSDGEAVTFAMELGDLLRECGWTAYQGTGSGANTTGVLIRTTERFKWAEIVARELGRLGFDVAVTDGHSFEEIRVGWNR